MSLGFTILGDDDPSVNLVQTEESAESQARLDGSGAKPGGGEDLLEQILNEVDDFFEAELEKYNPHSIINEIRGHVKAWREIPNSRDWGVTPTTERLPQYWRDGNNFETIRPPPPTLL